MKDDEVKLSVVVLCWNSEACIDACLSSIFAQHPPFPMEVIAIDNGSSDATAALVRRKYPDCALLETGANLGYSGGNNAGIGQARGGYILILNPDTILPPGFIETFIAVADDRPEAGAFGCRVEGPGGVLQCSARPFPTPGRCWLEALCLQPLVRAFEINQYRWWPETTCVRPVDWVSGCCLLLRTSAAREAGGFDERLFYHFEEVDLCKRLRAAGRQVLYTPRPVVLHQGGNTWDSLSENLQLEKCRNRHRYFYKHHGLQGARSSRSALLAALIIRLIAYRVLTIIRPGSPQAEQRLRSYRRLISWNWKLDLPRFLQAGEEPA